MYQETLLYPNVVDWFPLPKHADVIQYHAGDEGRRYERASPFASGIQEDFDLLESENEIDVDMVWLAWLMANAKVEVAIY
jgi:hypothetical protein